MSYRKIGPTQQLKLIISDRSSFFKTISIVTSNNDATDVILVHHLTVGPLSACWFCLFPFGPLCRWHHASGPSPVQPGPFVFTMNLLFAAIFRDYITTTRKWLSCNVDWLLVSNISFFPNVLPNGWAVDKQIFHSGGSTTNQ